MFETLRFYLSHSFNDLRVNKRLTFFALLSVAAGVAAIVSLQTLALMISNTLEVNLQENNRGDVSVQLQLSDNDSALATDTEAGILTEKPTSFLGQSQATYTLSEQGLDALQIWIDEGPYADQVDMTYRLYTSDNMGVLTGAGTGTTITDIATGNQATQLSTVMIDTNEYPFYSDIMTNDNRSLADVMQQATDIVISEETAEFLDVSVGDAVQLNGTDATFTIVGIVSVENEVKGLKDFIAGVYGFYYLDWSAVELFDSLSVETQNIYFQLANPAQTVAFDEALVSAFPYFQTTNIDDLRADNQQLTKQIDSFVATMGLISLLLGSIGIINTMQVIVRRRMLEVAVLKTLGLQAEQVTILFLTEAFLVGILGSLVGVVLGWVGTFALKGVVAGIFGSQIAFIIEPVPAINGFVVGVLVATVFGFLPTLTAGQVRPGIVLRPAEGIIPRAGIFQSLFALLIIIFSVSIIVTGIIGSNFALAFAVVSGAFLAAGLIYLLLMFMIWIIGRFTPSFGFVDLKIALRQMLIGRSRGASTLLALVVGVFSLSTITLFADSISNILESVIESSGGNVIVSIPNYNQVDQVETIVAEIDGVNSTIVSFAYSAELVSYTSGVTGETYDAEGLSQLMQDSNINFPQFFNGTGEEQDKLQQEALDTFFSNTEIEARDDFEANDAQFISGRDITSDELNLPVIVIPENEIINGLGIRAGDTVTYNIASNSLGGASSEQVTFEIVGVKAESVELNFIGVGIYAPSNIFSESMIPTTISMMIDVDDEQVPALRRALSEVPGIFALETSIFTRLITSLLGTFVAFPTMVAALGLVVGGVVIANSVALATMERRHEIAVMKSVGLQRERVLGMILLENGILGFIGGLIGVGFGLIALVGFSVGTQSSLNLIPYGMAFGLMLLCVGVALMAAITSAWDASGEKPLTVLRYE